MIGRTRRRKAIGAVAIAAAAATWASGLGVHAEVSPSGAPEVLVSQVSVDPTVQAGEAWVVTDPDHPEYVMVAWLATRSSKDYSKPGYCGIGVSHDGGETWTSSHMPVALTTDPLVVVDEMQDPPICGDPVAGVGPNGEFYVAAAMVGSPSFTQGIASYDHGVTWTDSTEVFGVNKTRAGLVANAPHPVPSVSMGRAWMAVDPITGDAAIHSQEDGSAEGRFIGVFKQATRTWTTPHPVDSWPSRSAGPLGMANGIIGFTLSGSTGPAVFQTTETDSVTDESVTWTQYPMPYNGGGTTAADPTAAGRFAVLRTVGTSVEVWITDDRGEHWSPQPTVIAAPRTPSKPFIAFSPTGALGVVWRNAGDAAGTADVWAVVSNDGGTTFSAPVALATAVPTPTFVGPGDDCACNLHLDDTTLSATWTMADPAFDGQSQLYYGRFDYTGL